ADHHRLAKTASLDVDHVSGYALGLQVISHDPCALFGEFEVVGVATNSVGVSHHIKTNQIDFFQDDVGDIVKLALAGAGERSAFVIEQNVAGQGDSLWLIHFHWRGNSGHQGLVASAALRTAPIDGSHTRVLQGDPVLAHQIVIQPFQRQVDVVEP